MLSDYKSKKIISYNNTNKILKNLKKKKNYIMSRCI